MWQGSAAVVGGCGGERFCGGQEGVEQAPGSMERQTYLCRCCQTTKAASSREPFLLAQYRKCSWASGASYQCDGRCLFDQLRVPTALRSWFGRPSISVKELLGTGLLTIRDIKRSLAGSESFCIDGVVFPVSVVWPMGFAWSSYLAQCTMLGVCQRAHLTSSKVLAEDAEPPLDLGSTFALATDDIMHFSSRGVQHSESVGRDIDRAMVACGVQKHAGKDINAAADGTAHWYRLGFGSLFCS